MAGSDFLLKIDGIDGESNQKGHEKWIELQSWSWGETNSGSHGIGSGGGSGKVQMQDFHYTVEYGVSSPKLFLACADGTHIKTAELHCRKAGTDQQIFLVWKFCDLLISSYQTGGSGHGGSALPNDSVSFNFTKIEMEYKPQKKDGTLDAGIKAGYNVKLGTKV